MTTRKDSAANIASRNDYARCAVPDSARVGALEIALVVIGGTIGFAIFIVAAQIGGSLGYSGAALAFGIGSAILGVMGAATSYVGARTRLSTYLLTQYTFGQAGAKLSNLVVAISLIGWFGVISNFLGQAGQQMLLTAFAVTVPAWLTVLIASGLMVAVTLAGFKGIDKLALYLVPIMLLFIGYAAYTSLGADAAGSFTQNNDFTLSTAISAVVGSYIAGVIIQPDYSRFARSHSGAAWAVFFALGVCFPLVQYFSAIPSLSLGNADIIAVMTLLGLGIPAFFLLVFGAWSSNVLCLYSSGISIATVLPKRSFKQIISAIGIIGTALALVEAQSYLINFLVVLGVLIPPIGAIYCLDAFWLRRFAYADTSPQAGYRWLPLLSWAVGIIAGFCSHFALVNLTGISSLDSLIASALCFVLLQKRALLAKQGFSANSN